MQWPPVEERKETGRTIYKYSYQEIEALNNYSGRLIVSCNLGEHPKDRRAFRIYENLQEKPTIIEITHEEPDGSVGRRISQVNAQARNQQIVSALKHQYHDKCMFCGIQLKVSEGTYYSEAAHIKPLGEHANGPDNNSNMIILCPNHHKQFDHGVLWLEGSKNNYRIKSAIKNDPLDGKTLKLLHTICNNHVKYHREEISFCGKNKI
ncbi:hypothetical protein FMR86_16015 [Desulfovibrio sp. JC010]|nr:HNH endonuclease [Desulfovibrio sp. JC010]NDV28155.1 hypothetical protein [Desulfovibrio sp. JC010]